MAPQAMTRRISASWQEDAVVTPETFTVDELAQAVATLSRQVQPERAHLLDVVHQSILTELRRLHAMTLPELVAQTQREIVEETRVPASYLAPMAPPPILADVERVREMGRAAFGVTEETPAPTLGDWTPTRDVAVLQADYQARLGFPASVYQAIIFDWIEYGSGCAVANAVAGSGKTTTAVVAAKLVHGDAIFCSFASKNAKDLGRRLEGSGMASGTIHSLGNTAVRNCLQSKGVKVRRVEDAKYKLEDACRAVALDRPLIRQLEREQQDKAVTQLQKLVEFRCKTLSDPATDAIYDMIEHFGIEIADDKLESCLVGCIDDVLARSEEQALHGGLIDFLDMLWLVYKWDLPMTQFDWIFVDEAQDLSALQLFVVLKCRRAGGRMLFIGDERQAIYGFNGADAESFHQIGVKTQAVRLNLNINYRCSNEHLALIKHIVPAIEGRPDAPVGRTVTVPKSKLAAQIKMGDLVLCRKTAPLVNLCLDLIAHKIPAKVLGREIGKQLIDVVRAVAKQRGYSWPEFGTYLAMYEGVQMSKLMGRRGTESKQQALADKIEAVKTIYESDTYQADSADELCREIEGLFEDEGPYQRSPVTLMTVHRAKGAEAPRVWLLHKGVGDIALSWRGQQDWEMVQEQNLTYVACTRPLAVADNPESGFLGFITDEEPEADKPTDTAQAQADPSPDTLQTALAF